MQFGMYTEVRDERTLYFDAVRIANYLGACDDNAQPHAFSSFIIPPPPLCYSTQPCALDPCTDVPFETWISDQVHLPTVALSSPIDGAHLGSGSATIVAADAHDPAGSK